MRKRKQQGYKNRQSNSKEISGCASLLCLPLLLLLLLWGKLQFTGLKDCGAPRGSCCAIADAVTAPCRWSCFLYIMIDAWWFCRSSWVNRSRPYPSLRAEGGSLCEPWWAPRWHTSALCWRCSCETFAGLVCPVTRRCRMPYSVRVTAVPATLAPREEGAAALQCAAPMRQRARKGECGQQGRGSATVCQQLCGLVTFLGRLFLYLDFESF